MPNHSHPPTRQRPLLLMLVLLALFAAACGQKSGVALQAGGEGTNQETLDDGTAGSTDAGTAEEGAVEGEVVEGEAGGGTEGAGGTTGGGTTGPAGSGGTTGGTSTGGTTATTVAPSPAAGPNDKMGVSDKEIVIGIHAPVTGAAPFPQSSFEAGRDLYWKWLADRGGVQGRNVRVVFRDDQYNPSRAVQVCREMVEKEQAFLLIGAGGADQITACAKYANSARVPYLSAGVNEAGVSDLATYFAMSQSYAQQSPPIAQLVKRKLGLTKIGIVVADTPSFADGHASFTKAAEAEGLQIVRNSRINKNASQSETLAEASQQQQAGAEAVYVLTAPTVFIQFAQQAAGQGFSPQYVGPGITSGLNTVANVGCPGIGQARFMSPFPGLEDGSAGTYKEAYQKYNGGNGDDVGFALWGLAASLHKMLDASGRDIGRAKFIATLETGQPFDGGVFPVVKFGRGDHLGASDTHLLRADCGRRVYVTEAKNVAGF